jgi:hypothetical protein
MRKFIAIFFILVGIFSTASPVLACPVPDYLTCDELGSGYQFGFGVKPAQNGTYILVNTINTRLFGGAPADRNNSVTISNSDLRTFDWSASLGIDAIIVQAGRQSTVRYFNEDLSGAGVYGALQQDGRPYQIEKMYFCYDYELAVDVEAEGTGTGGSGAWEITKTVADAAKTAFAGESAAFDYTVATALVAGGEGSNFSLETTLTITNNSPLTAALVGGSVVLNPGNINLLPDMRCAGAPLTFPRRLYPHNQLVCTATTPLESQVEGTVAAQIRTSGYVGGGSATDEVEWTLTGGGGGGTSVTVTDTNAAFGGPYTISNSQTWNYSVDLACPVDPAAYANGPVTVALDNTAAITETGQSASQSVSLVCYAPTVSTSANASYNVQYVWEITKTSPLSNLELDELETANVDYTATVDVASTVQTDATVAGTVTVGNPRPDAPMTVAVADEIAPGVPVQFSDCTSPVTIPAGGSVTCNFTTSVETLPAGNNTATATLNSITFTATAPFAGTGMTETDECVTVYDSAFTEPLGVVCANQAPYVFPYTVTVGPYEGHCRDTSYVNTAYFYTNDTGAEGFDTYILDIYIKCPVVTNCVRTIQYWLAHGDPTNPTTYNATWNLVQPSGPSSPFYTTGWTWIQTLGMNSSSSNYLRLAQAYIAAKLNILYGAIPNDLVTTNTARAEELLAQYASSQNLVTGSVATEFRSVTTVLSNFNRGALGVPVCSDCNDRPGATGIPPVRLSDN